LIKSALSKTADNHDFITELHTVMISLNPCAEAVFGEFWKCCKGNSSAKQLFHQTRSYIRHEHS